MAEDENGVDVAKLNKRQKEIYKTWKRVGGLFDLQATLDAEATHNPEELDAKSQEAELVLGIIHGRDHAVKRACLVCQRHFMTDYLSNRYCSNDCRREALASVGIHWNPEKSARERWGGHPPATISPEALKALQECVLALADQLV